VITITIPVVLDSISLVITVIHVVLFHQMVIILQLIHVTGIVTADTTNQGIVVSVITRTLVVLDSISLEALATHVTQPPLIHTIRRAARVIGVVVVDILDQGIVVSAITIITVR
jgi:hypothetical protein